MALTEADESVILSAIARGEQKVRFADGREVTYRTVAELQQALAIARSERSVPLNRTTLGSFRRG